MAEKRICSELTCGKLHYSRGFCRNHYEKAKRQARPRKPRAKVRRPQISVEFLRSLIGTSSTECISWPFARNKQGYGSLKFDGKHYGAHRMMCRMAHGEPSDIRLHAAHSCGNGHLGCVNPNHLRWATPLENYTDQLVYHVAVTKMLGPKKLEAAQVIEIRCALASGLSGKEVAEKFGVSNSTIHAIKTRKTWSHVP